MTELVAARITTDPDFSAKRIKRRYAAERRFRMYGALALLAAGSVLGLLLFSIIGKGYSAFTQTEIAIDVTLDPDMVDPDGSRDPAVLATSDYQGLFKRALYERFPEVT